MAGVLKHSIRALLLFAEPVTLSANAGKEWANDVDSQGRRVQSLKIQAPAMTEEDQYGYTMPVQYKCDSCRAVAYHLNAALKRKQPKSRRLQEWETEELFQETCAQAFKGYGITLAGGQNVLSGPGLKQREELQSGQGAIQMGGETWEKRLGEVCRKLVYDKIGEDSLYDMFFQTGQLSDDLCSSAVRDCATDAAESGERAGSRAKKTSKKSTKKAQGQSKDVMDFQTFLKTLASEHGHKVPVFSGKQDRKHWQQVLLSASAWIAESERAVEV